MHRAWNGIGSSPTAAGDASGEIFLTVVQNGSDMGDLMLLYSAGFGIVYLLLALMTLRAWSLREVLQLDERELLVTLSTMGAHAIMGAFAFLSCALVLFGGEGLAPSSGMI